MATRDRDDLMSAAEAGGLLSAMTPGTLEVSEIRDGRLTDAGMQELAVVIHDDPRAHQKDDGTWHSVIVCRGMDGPTREANAAAFAAVKRALETVIASDAALRAERAQHAAEVAALRAAARGVLTALEWYDEDDDESAADAEAACQELDALLVLTAPAATTGGA